MDDNNIIPFPNAKKELSNDEHMNLWLGGTPDLTDPNFALTIADMLSSADDIELDRQLDELSDCCFDLQLLVANNPEIAQFVIAHIKKLIKSMEDRLT